MTSVQSNTYTYAYRSADSTHAWLDGALIDVIARLPVKTILDMGCGNGHFAGVLASRGHQVVGCDPEESAIRLAREHVPQARFHQLGVYDDPALAMGQEHVDMVLASEVIEHLMLPRHLPRFASKVLPQGGYLVVSTPYYGSYIKNLLCSLANKWDDQFTALWDGGHIKFWSLKTLDKLLSSEGFDIVDHVLVNRASPWLRWFWPNNIIVVARKR
jgi:2-polyprenyl-3-methyl-5-hydroxy-6-metoxy-1,4-benzoquinol methylase